MKQEAFRLQDSVLKLKLGEDTLSYLNYINILTISDLLERMNEVRENKKIFPEIKQALERQGLIADSKLSYTEQEIRSQERKNIIEKNSEIISKNNINEILESDIEMLKVSQGIKNRLKKYNIGTISKLLEYNSIELFQAKILAEKSIYKIADELEHYGLSLDIKDGSTLQKSSEKSQKSETLQTEGPKKANIDKERWYHLFEHVKEIYNYLGHSIILKGYKYDGIDLGDWVGIQRKYYRSGKLAEEFIINLESVNIIWNARSKEGHDKKQQIMQEQGIKEIQLIDGEIVTIYENGEVKTTKEIKEPTKTITNTDVLDENNKDHMVDESILVEEDINVEEDTNTSIVETSQSEKTTLNDSLLDDLTATISLIEEENRRKQALIEKAEILLLRYAEVCEEQKKLNKQIETIMTLLTEEMGETYVKRQA